MIIRERVVMNMQGFHPIIAFGVILLYTAVLLVILTCAIAIRLLPMKARIPVVSGSLEKIRTWLR